LAESFGIEYLNHLERQGELLTSTIDNKEAGIHTDFAIEAKSAPESADGIPEIHEQTKKWYEDKVRLLKERIPMLLMRRPRDGGDVYPLEVQPLGVRLRIGATSFRYGDETTPTCTVKVEAGGIIYCVQVKKTAVEAIKFATSQMDYVWCDSISITFLRKLDALVLDLWDQYIICPKEREEQRNGNRAFNAMGKVYKFYTCIPSLNWVEDSLYRERGWMWQEYICGEMLICISDKLDMDTLEEILEERDETHVLELLEKNRELLEESNKSCTSCAPCTRAVTKIMLKRKRMTVQSIADLLKSAVRHFRKCIITKEEDLPNACFSLLKSYGLFEELPQQDQALEQFANTGSNTRFDFSLHPLRVIIRLLIKSTHEKDGIECALQFIKSGKGKRFLKKKLKRDPKFSSSGSQYLAHSPQSTLSSSISHSQLQKPASYLHCDLVAVTPHSQVQEAPVFL
jgi:hypothetical protein